MRSTRFLSILAAALALGGCASPDTAIILCTHDANCPVGLVCRGGQCLPPLSMDAGAPDGGTAQDGGSVADGGSEDGGTADGGSERDGGAADGGSDAGTLAAFGQPCTGHGDCQSQYCLQGGRRAVCTRPCSQDCPVEYVCRAFFERGQIVNLCVPFDYLYCVPCRASNECPSPGDTCTSIGGALYCTHDCSADGVCPAEYQCRDVAFADTAEGRAGADGGGDDGGAPTFRQCVPVTGKCPGCVDRDNDGYGAGADCLGPDCDDTNPDIRPGATEVCDGKDNNCDGQVDEPFDLKADNANCGRCGVACNVAAGERCCDGVCVDPATSRQHCGTCGNACGGDGSVCCGGACHDTWSEPDHCGGCSLACTNAHGTVACAGGQCNPTCAPGYWDCNGNRRDGCETDLAVVETCGGCQTDVDCPPGFYCDGGVCRKKKPLGEACSVTDPQNPGRECRSGYCVDGVCCNTDCAGGCRSCNREGSRGFCTFVPEGGADPRASCAVDPSMPCLRDGKCDGAGGCRATPSGVVCEPQMCSGAIQRNARTCDGFGHCVDPVPAAVLCAPYACVGNSCVSTCSIDAPCAPGYECIAGTCTLTAGAPCNVDRDCSSGFCVDGYCCNERCDGLCESCGLPGKQGACSAIPADQPAPNECPAEGTPCGRTGFCSGFRGACQYPLPGTVCQAPSCTADLTGTNRADQCNGTGTCVDNGVQSCLPFKCNQATGTCRTSCTADADCATGYRCKNGQCLKDNGQACVANNECFSGACCSGICRDTTSDLGHCGACGSVCNLANASERCVNGTCTLVACDAGWGNCDGNTPNGCETPLNTNSNCGACGRVCAPANATGTCSTGTCLVASCLNGFANCDGSHTNGCERRMDTCSGSCCTSEGVGTYQGDNDYCDFRTSRFGTGETCFTTRITENRDSCHSTEALFELSVPAGVDMDLYVTVPSGVTCYWWNENAQEWRVGCSGINLTGQSERVWVGRGESCFLGFGDGTDQSFDATIEIRWYSGSACANWGFYVSSGEGC